MILIVLGILVLVLLYGLLTFEVMHRTAAAIFVAGIILVLNLVFHFMEYTDMLNGIDIDTILLLMNMMIIVGILGKTGLFEYISLRLVMSFKDKPYRLLLILLILTGVVSAFIDNVTTVLLIAPVIIDVFEEIGVTPVPALLGIVFASNIGGTATLIGDPPNILIGSMADIGFMQFIYNLTPIVFVDLLVFTAILPYLFRGWYREYCEKLGGIDDEVLYKKLKLIQEGLDEKLLRRTIAVLAIVIALFFLEDVFKYPPAVPAMIGAGLLMVFVRKKLLIEDIMNFIDWTTLVFFMAMFIIIQGIQGMGLLDWIAMNIMGLTTAKTGLILVITWISAFLSAFIDNIPFVMSMIPVIKSITTTLGMNPLPLYWSLSLGGCLGGNGTMVGASANIVVVSLASKLGHDISFREFLKYGMTVMTITVLIATIYLLIRY